MSKRLFHKVAYNKLRVYSVAPACRQRLDFYAFTFQLSTKIAKIPKSR